MNEQLAKDFLKELSEMVKNHINSINNFELAALRDLPEEEKVIATLQKLFEMERNRKKIENVMEEFMGIIDPFVDAENLFRSRVREFAKKREQQQ